ncbi:zinc-dependent metalloprotease [Sphingomonas sp.]|uniref:zinc-dependent metalloprotease n=1 Tax=Sphingomonas sp. TaxID=28214 RepID=UPI003B3B63F0
MKASDWMRWASTAAMVAALSPVAALAAPSPAGSSATAAKSLAGLPRADGYVPFYWDAAEGRVLIEVPVFDQDVLYYVSAATNPGSVQVPFDRGIISSSVIHFQRAGGKVVVNQINMDYRAPGAAAKTQEGVADSFPTSVLAVLPVVSEAGGKVVVDGTPLFMRDAGNVIPRIKRAKQGTFRFEPARSSFYPKRMKAFPENTEIETIATFTSDAPGEAISDVTPADGVLTLRIHHSFLKAPTGYVPREADPRIGVSAIRFHDFSKPIDDYPMTKWITRWRLEKKDPSAPLSEPKTPIVYYFDPAIPDPIRQAMKEGLLWWNRAFEAAGFKNAIEAKDAPADMDPMDIRYAYVLWIHRDERGFSSSGNYLDPRTGEVLGSKTHMDTYRLRTIASYYDAYSGGLPADGSGLTIADPSITSADQFNAMPKGQRDMAYLRQALLTAHELGHTLGFQHNWAANLNNRSSVMEYPTPRVKVTNGKLDLSESFMTSVGAYDTYMTRYAYTPFAQGREKAGLDGVVKDMRDHGIVFTQGTDPRWTWYDDRESPEENLRETAAVRKIALDAFGPQMLKPGEPIGALRDMRLWIVYLQQRYAIESGIRYIGGMLQNISVKDEAHPLPPTEFIPAARQRAILDLLMDAIDPKNLEIPESLLIQLTPDPERNLEDLSRDDVFDQLRAARILAAMVVEPLFAPDRAARMVALSARTSDTLTFPQMVDTVLAASWGRTPAGSVQHRALLRAVQEVTLRSMMTLGVAEDTAPEARAFVLDRLGTLAEQLRKRSDADALTAAFYRQSGRDIERYLEDPGAHMPKHVMPEWGDSPRSRFPLPPGPPIG